METELCLRRWKKKKKLQYILKTDTVTEKSFILSPSQPFYLSAVEKFYIQGDSQIIKK